MRYLANLVPELLREQRTVNPLLVQLPLRFLKAGPAARQRHDGHRGTDLTLLTGAQRDTVLLP